MKLDTLTAQRGEYNVLIAAELDGGVGVILLCGACLVTSEYCIISQYHDMKCHDISLLVYNMNTVVSHKPS